MTINVAILGYGLSATTFHIPFITTTPGLALHSIVQRSPTETNSAVKDHPSIKAYRSTAELYAAPETSEVSLVVVTTSNTTHFSYCKEALENGKNVVVEKPFATSSKEADELIALAEKVGKTLTVFQNRRFDSDFLSLRALLSATPSPFGKLVSIESHYDRFKAVEVNPSDTRAWKREQSYGNGTLWDLGTHLIDQALTLFGLPVRVFGQIRDERGASVNPKAIWGEDGFLDDFFEATLYYDGREEGERGFVVRLEAGTQSLRERQVRFIVRGSEGGWVKYHLDPQEDQLKGGLLPTAAEFGVEDESIHGTFITPDGTATKTPSQKGNYGKFYSNLVSAINGEKQLVVKPQEAADVIRLIELLGESNRQGKVLAVSR
ncbi:NAD(P)-binding protein [Morchella conica CCBAS932]|uniref:NAD(P)-binding protein n=1 Tax=Morchella conica CCBAS932 TaxID=1392247 RepID=A0A3N4L1M6_9PEZI|nr:NAD(P)-binding protein [Morchella conica CCBAS932]